MKLPSIRIQRSSVILWLAIIALLIFVALSVTLRKTEEDMEQPQEKATPVHAAPVHAQPADDVVQLPGRIEPDIRSRLAVDKGGRITEILVEQGDRVDRGQVLLRIDDRVWRAIMEGAEVEWREAEKEFNRWSELIDTGAVSPSEFDAIRLRYDRARIQLEEARVHVDQCVVRSPVDGMVNERFVEVGEFAPEGGAVLEVVVSDPVRLVLQIPERDIGSVEQGAELDFRVSVLDPRMFRGAVTHIAEAASPESNSYRVEATCPNPDRRLRPGMIASAELLRARIEDAIVAPLSAIIPRKGEHFVFVERDGRAVRRLVKIDRILGENVILASGLNPGDTLIVEGHRELIDGALIEIIAANGDK